MTTIRRWIGLAAQEAAHPHGAREAIAAAGEARVNLRA